MVIALLIILTTILVLIFLRLVLYKPNPQTAKPKKGFLYTWLFMVLIYSTVFFIINFIFPPNNWIPSLFGFVVTVTFVTIYWFKRYRATKV